MIEDQEDQDRQIYEKTRKRSIRQSLVVLPDAECWPLKPKDAESLRN